MPVIGGDPGAVEAAAGDLGRAAADLEEAGVSIGVRGRTVTAAWDGDASDAAATTIAAISTRVVDGASAAGAAEAVYRTYAGELRAAQEAYAAGEALVETGRAGQRAAASQAVRASDRPVIDPGREPAVAGAQAAMAAATAVVAEGEAAMAAAVERERVANEAAATSIRKVVEAVRLMTMAAPAQQPYGPTAGSAAATAEGPQLENAGEDGWFYDTVAAARERVDFLAAAAGPLTRASLDLSQDVGRDLVGGVGDGLWATGPGLVGDLYSLSPFEGDQQMAEDIDDAHDRLEDWWGADTGSGVYQGAETATGVATALAGGVGLGRAAVGGVLRFVSKRQAGDTAQAVASAPRALPPGPQGPGPYTGTAVSGDGLFVTTGRGTTYDIPPGWTQRMARNDQGLVFQRPGSVGERDSIRIMEPDARNPDGYVRVYNDQNQAVDVNGKPASKPETHISQLYQGPWKFVGDNPQPDFWPTR